MDNYYYHWAYYQHGYGKASWKQFDGSIHDDIDARCTSTLCGGIYDGKKFNAILNIEFSRFDKFMIIFTRLESISIH